MNSVKKNLFYVYSVNLINGLAGIAFIPFALKSLGAEGYGVYSIFVILTSYIYFVEMGVAKYFVRIIAQTTSENQKNSAQTIVGIYIKIAFLLLLLTPILLYIIPRFIFPTENEWLIGGVVLFAALDYLLSIPTTIQLTYNIGNEKFLEVSKFNLISGLSKHIFLIGAVILTKSVIILIIMVLIRRIFDIYYAKKFLLDLPTGGWKPRYVKGEFKKILSESLLLSTAQLTQVIILSLGTFLVNKSFSIKEVGIYKSIFDLATKVWFVSNSLGQVIFPRFSALLKVEEEKKLLLERLPFYYRMSWILYHLLFLLIFFVLPLIPNFLLIEDLLLFFFILYGVCLNAHTNLSYEFLQADSKLKEVIFTSIITIILMVGTYYLSLQSYGFYAIGVSWIGSQLVNSIIMDYFVLKSGKLKKKLLTVVFYISTLVLMWIMITVLQ